MPDIWAVAIPVGVLVVAIAGIFMNGASQREKLSSQQERLLGGYLSIREHMEYKLSVQREMDKLHERLSQLENTRPTTGELEARLGTTKTPREK